MFRLFIAVQLDWFCHLSLFCNCRVSRYVLRWSRCEDRDPTLKLRALQWLLPRVSLAGSREECQVSRCLVVVGMCCHEKLFKGMESIPLHILEQLKREANQAANSGEGEGDTNGVGTGGPVVEQQQQQEQTARADVLEQQRGRTISRQLSSRPLDSQHPSSEAIPSDLLLYERSIINLKVARASYEAGVGRLWTGLRKHRLKQKLELGMILALFCKSEVAFERERQRVWFQLSQHNLFFAEEDEIEVPASENHDTVLPLLPRLSQGSNKRRSRKTDDGLQGDDDNEEEKNYSAPSTPLQLQLHQPQSSQHEQSNSPQRQDDDDDADDLEQNILRRVETMEVSGDNNFSTLPASHPRSAIARATSFNPSALTRTSTIATGVSGAERASLDNNRGRGGWYPGKYILNRMNERKAVQEARRIEREAAERAAMRAKEISWPFDFTHVRRVTIDKKGESPTGLKV